MQVYASFDGKSIDIRYSYSFGVDMFPLPQRQEVKEHITWNQERREFQITVSSGEQKMFTGYLDQKDDRFRDEGKFSIEKFGTNELRRTRPSMPIGEGYDGLSSSTLAFKGKKSASKTSRIREANAASNE